MMEARAPHAGGLRRGLPMIGRSVHRALPAALLASLAAVLSIAACGGGALAPAGPGNAGPSSSGAIAEAGPTSDGVSVADGTASDNGVIDDIDGAGAVQGEAATRDGGTSDGVGPSEDAARSEAGANEDGGASDDGGGCSTKTPAVCACPPGVPIVSSSLPLEGDPRVCGLTADASQNDPALCTLLCGSCSQFLFPTCQLDTLDDAAVVLCEARCPQP
jgi:hypothetical protein